MPAPQPPLESRAAPHQHLSLLDSTSIIVGIIIGSSIYCSTPLIAQQVPNVAWLAAVWVIGGVFTLIGALCYAEMASAYPEAGGDYVFLTEAFGRRLGLLFAWSQFWIIRPGSVAIFAFIYAYYANQILPLPESWRPLLVHAVGSVVVLSGINLLGVRAGKTTQNLLTLVKFLGLLAIVVVGLSVSSAAGAPSGAPAGAAGAPSGSPRLDLGVAMIFIFFAYSGWNEMAYVSSEVRHPRKNILRALLLGTLAVSAVYIAVNLAFVHALGMDGLRQSQAVATDVLSLGIGPRAGRLISALICITVLGGINGMLFTGARIFYAVGTGHRLFAWLGHWNSQTDTPARPLIVQAVATVAMLVGFGWRQQQTLQAFNDSVAFTSPTFWLFLYLVSHAYFVLRVRQSGLARTYRAPFYPVLPLLFCLANAYMFFKSLDYAIEHTPWGLVASIAVLAIGAGLGFWVERGNNA
jgi:amino acid transporter